MRVLKDSKRKALLMIEQHGKYAQVQAIQCLQYSRYDRWEEEYWEEVLQAIKHEQGL